MRSCGLVRHERLWRAAQHIAPLDCRLGDPLILLRDLSHERFDLVLAEPPFGMRVPVASDPDDPRGRLDIADLVLWRVAPMVADRGAALFRTPDDFFWAKSRRRLWPQFAERGLHPRAVISVDPALAPSSSIATSLVLFTGEERDQLFVGRLERSTAVRALVRNRPTCRSTPPATTTTSPPATPPTGPVRAPCWTGSSLATPLPRAVWPTPTPSTPTRPRPPP